jgi:hypothetical protein
MHHFKDMMMRCHHVYVTVTCHHWHDVAALSIRRVVEAYSKGGLLTNDHLEAQRKLLYTAYVARPA